LPQIATVCSLMGYRLVDRAFVWANRPHDDMLLAESEKQVPFGSVALQVDVRVCSVHLHATQQAVCHRRRHSRHSRLRWTSPATVLAARPRGRRWEEAPPVSMAAAGWLLCSQFTF
jgi:hypothetical protein